MEQETRHKQETSKMQVQEELLFKANRVVAQLLSKHEQQRRINNITPIEKSMKQKKAELQQQLLMHVNNSRIL